MEPSYRISSSPSTLQTILKLKYEYNTILSGQVWDQLLRVRLKYFELGDNPHKLLAGQQRGLQANKAIHKIKSETGDILVDPKGINDHFRVYYEQLYKSRPRGDISNWLGLIGLSHYLTLTLNFSVDY